MNSQPDPNSPGVQSGRHAPGDVPLDYGPSKAVPLIPQQGANWIYATASQLLRIYYLFAARVRVEGWENVPKKGGGVVVCNHGPGNDYFPLGISLPRMPNFLAKIEAFQFHPLLGWILANGGSIPVNRGTGDVEALRTAVQFVREGKLVMVFPEGHRSEDGKLQNGKTGATRIALEANAPIIPVGVIGAEAAYRNFPRFWKRPVVLVRIGKPFVLEGKGGQDRAAVVAGTRRIMLSIAELLPYEMRGVWAEPTEPTTRAERSRARAFAASVAANAAGNASFPLPAPADGQPTPASPQDSLHARAPDSD